MFRKSTTILAMCTLGLTMSACGHDNEDVSTKPPTKTTSVSTTTTSSSTSSSLSTSTSGASSVKPTSSSATSTSASKRASSTANAPTKGSSSSTPTERQTTSVAATEAPSAASSSTPKRDKTQTAALGSLKVNVPSGMSVIASGPEGLRLVRGSNQIVLLSTIPGTEELGPLDQRCEELGMSLNESTNNSGKPVKFSVSTEGRATVCKIHVTGSLKGTSKQGVLTTYEISDASGNLYSINASDFSTKPSSKDADALLKSILDKIA